MEDVFDRPPRPSQALWAHNIFEGSNKPFRMTSFVCNDPGTAGYSVFCGIQPYTILPHTPPIGERDLEAYAAQDRGDRARPVWLYAPRNPGELIAEIWARVRDGSYQDARSVALVVSDPSLISQNW